MLKVCIISCGMIANSAHIPAYRRFPDSYEIAAVSDINEAAAKDTAGRHGIRHYYADAGQMLAEEKPDVVSVCVPNCFHKMYTLMALEHGANVLCEKPIALTYHDALEMFQCAKKHGKLLMACQSMRFTPDRLAAKEYMKKSGVDDIYYGELSRIRRRGIPTWGTFHIKKINGGGAFIDIGVHILDALVWLMGNPKVKSVNAIAMQNHKYEIGSIKESGALTGEVHNRRMFDPEEMDVEDFSCGYISFENGAKVSFKVAWAANMPEASDIRLVGKRVGIDLPSGKIYFGEHGEDMLKMSPLLYTDTPFAGHIYLVDNMRRALMAEESLFVAPEETLNVSAIIEMFYKSAELQREVSFEEIYENGLFENDHV